MHVHKCSARILCKRICKKIRELKMGNNLRFTSKIELAVELPTLFEAVQ